MEKIKVIMKRPDSKWYITNISASPESVKKLLGDVVPGVPALSFQKIAQDAVLIYDAAARVVPSELFGWRPETLIIAGVGPYDQLCDVHPSWIESAKQWNREGKV